MPWDTMEELYGALYRQVARDCALYTTDPDSVTVAVLQDSDLLVKKSYEKKNYS